MVNRIYNRFDVGVKQENSAIFTSSPSFIDSKNLDGLKDGQGVTLGPKVNKLIETTSNVTGILSWSSTDLDRSIIGCDNGEIYKFNSADNTPEYTLSRKIVKIVEWNQFVYIFARNNLTDSTVYLYRINKANIQLGNWSELDQVYYNGVFNTIDKFPVLIAGINLFIGTNSSIKQITYEASTAGDGYYAGSLGSFGFPDDFVKGLTLQGSTIAVYTRSGNVFFWNGESNSQSARGYTGARVIDAVNLNGRDYITFEDGQMKVGSFTQFQKLYKPKNSFRLEDNSQQQVKLDFSVDGGNFDAVNVTALDDIYFTCNDSIKGIYKLGSIIPGTQPGIHKIITENHNGDSLSTVNTMFFRERTLRRLYIGYSDGVDYVDLDSLESCSSGYGVTEVLTGGTSFKKELNVVRATFQNITADKTAKLYYRVNNGAWILIRDINTTTDDIYYRENISTDSTGSAFIDFVDIQFKVELNSTTNDNKPPMLCELFIDYSIKEA